MKIQLLSDIHVEFWRGLGKAGLENQLYSLVQPADVLVLAGDINTGRTNTVETIKFFAQHYKHVIYLPGNHEYYAGLRIDEYNSLPKSLPDNVYYLNPGVVYINGITFVGATLWTNFGEDAATEMLARRFINDFSRTKITPHDMKSAFYRDSEFIKYVYENRNTDKIVVATHFMPAIELVHPMYAKSELNRYFANDLSGWIAELENVTWLYGHTHMGGDTMIGQTRCLAAPVGYPGEHQAPYKPLVFEL